MKYPVFTAPVSRDRGAMESRNTFANLSQGGGVSPSLFGFNLCDLLPEPARSICHAVGRGIGTE